MRKFTQLTGIVTPIDRANIDTDMIIPKQFLKSIKRTGFGQNLFDELRYLDEGEADQSCEGRPLNKNFELNQARYAGSNILISRQNFGCGSSREHAPWALEDYGFRCVIASSFADIFFNNCFKNGLLPIILSEETIEQLFQEVFANEGYELEIDLATQTVSTPGKQSFSFDIDKFRKHCLLNGLDEIGVTLEDVDAIKSYEEKRRVQAPWLFDAIPAVEK